MPPVCHMNLFNIFCFWASLCVFRQCVFSSLFNIFCFRASFCRCGRVVFVSFFNIPWVFSTFPASGLACEGFADVSSWIFSNISCIWASFWSFRQGASWSKSQDHHTTLEASPDAQRILHGKLLWSCIRHHPAKICVAGLLCLTCYIVTITLTF